MREESRRQFRCEGAGIVALLQVLTPHTGVLACVPTLLLLTEHAASVPKKAATVQGLRFLPVTWEVKMECLTPGLQAFGK